MCNNNFPTEKEVSLNLDARISMIENIYDADILKSITFLKERNISFEQLSEFCTDTIRKGIEFVRLQQQLKAQTEELKQAYNERNIEHNNYLALKCQYDELLKKFKDAEEFIGKVKCQYYKKDQVSKPCVSIEEVHNLKKLVDQQHKIILEKNAKIKYLERESYYLKDDKEKLNQSDSHKSDIIYKLHEEIDNLKAKIYRLKSTKIYVTPESQL